MMNTELPLITGGFLNVTQKCNLACKYCFVCQRPKDMTLQLAKDAADFFANNSKKAGDGINPSINFFGGEPMVRYKEIVKPLTEYIREKYGANFDLSITTNGTLLTKEIMEFFKENGVGMLFSIDGDKETQDINRPFHGGKGSFDRLESIIDMVLEYHPNMTFRATVEPPTHTKMYHNLMFAVKKGYTNAFFVPNIFRNWSDKEMKELEDEVIKIANYYIDEYKAGRKPIEFSHLESAKWEINRIVNLKDEDFREDGKGMPAFGRCGLGGNRFASVGFSGNLYSCQEMVENPDLGDKFKIGNIYTGTDDKARWKVMSGFDTAKVKSSKEGACETCVKRRICNGGCSINNYFKNNDLNIIDWTMCRYEQICIEQMARIIQELNKVGIDIYNRRGDKE